MSNDEREIDEEHLCVTVQNTQKITTKEDNGCPITKILLRPFRNKKKKNLVKMMMNPQKHIQFNSKIKH